MEHSATGSPASSLGRSACLNTNSMISSFFTIFEVLAVLLAAIGFCYGGAWSTAAGLRLPCARNRRPIESLAYGRL